MEVGLYPGVTEQQWYRVTTTCAQGPWELEISPAGERWGEAIELKVHAPRKVALQATLFVDDTQADTASGVFDASGRQDGAPDHTRCIADARERLALGRPGTGGGAPGGPATPGTRVPDEGSPPPPSTTVALELVTDAPPPATATTVVQVRLPDRAPITGRVRIRLWSIEPNDLDGVRFGLVRVAWRPNVPDAEYEAHLVREAERVRLEQEERRRRAPVPVVTEAPVVAPPVTVVDEAALERERERQRRAEEERAQATARRDAYCAAHHEDRGCWGAGGYQIHADLEARGRERDRYCEQNRDDARCWTDDDWAQRRARWNERVRVARTEVKPDGPPPAPQAETIPPKLSANAEWRPGYWHWLDGQWVWLAGMWRVPEADIVAEQTTTAPAPPPEPRVEAPAAAPVTSAVWIPGFWQWDGAAWVWVPGSWQLRPGASVTWRPPTWQPRGTVHILVPGAWVRIGGRR